MVCLRVLTGGGMIEEESGPLKLTLEHACIAEFHRALASTALMRPQLAKSLLGWEARKVPLGDGMLRYYRAWLATQA